MKIEVSEDYGFIVKEVYSGFTLRTAGGNDLHICMRDDTFEFNIMPRGTEEYNWKRINMQTGEVEDLGKFNIKDISNEIKDS